MRLLLWMTLAGFLGGCTVAKEVFAPHRDLKSPCTCLEDATPINTALLFTVPNADIA